MRVRSAVGALAFGALPGMLLACGVALSWACAASRVPISHGEPSAANLEARAAFLRSELPDQFTVAVAGPFVLVSEEPSERARERAAHIGRLTAELKRSFLADEPRNVIDVWLFADTESYRENTRVYLGDWPRTLGGYYAPRLHAVVVNLESGERTLAHEIVHPLLEASFPDCPAWFAEGLASLYETTGERDGRMVGLVDARVRRLQRALSRRRLPSLAALTVSTDREFYDDPRATNYLQARYLLHYLQEYELLASYYIAFRNDRPADPTGYRTLQRVTELEPDALQEQWEAHVQDL
jgi:hypothetical protein